MKLKAHLIYSFLLIFVFVFTITPEARALVPIERIEISHIDATAFPNIQVQIRLEDGERLPVEDLTPDDLILTENNFEKAYTVEPIQVGMQTVIVFDLGAGTKRNGASRIPRVDEMKQAAIEFVNSMQPGDVVELVKVLPGFVSVLETFTADKDALIEAIEMIQPNESENFTNGLLGIAKALEDFPSLTTDRLEPQYILFFSSGLQSTLSGPVSREQLEVSAVEAGIKVYSILFNEQTDPVRIDLIAQNTGGEYQHYDALRSAQGLFDQMEVFRSQYQLTYRSTDPTGNERQLAIVANTTEPNPPTARQTFFVTPAPQPPQITLFSINDGEPISRTADEYDDDPFSILPVEAKIEVELDFPDGYIREITQAQLFIDGDSTDRILVEPGTEFEFDWNLKSIIQTADFEFEIIITDELGLQTTRSKVQRVSVTVPPEPPPEEPPDPPDLCAGLRGIRGIGERLYDICRSLGITPSQMINMAISIAALVLVTMMWFNRGKIQVGVEKATDSVRRITNQIFKKGTTAKAQLKILGGPGDVGRTFEIHTETPIGADSAKSTVVLDYSFISGLHCTIHEEIAGGYWTIEDMGSTNGTFLNGRRLTSMERVRIEDNAIVDLGSSESDGIKLQFNLLKESETTVNGPQDIGFRKRNSRITGELKSKEPSRRGSDEEF